eukprot:gene6860-biopygen22461
MRRRTTQATWLPPCVRKSGLWVFIWGIEPSSFHRATAHPCLGPLCDPPLKEAAGRGGRFQHPHHNIKHVKAQPMTAKQSTPRSPAALDPDRPLNPRDRRKLPSARKHRTFGKLIYLDFEKKSPLGAMG